jgi:hypothetical protein
MSTPADGPDVTAAQIRITGPAKTQAVNVTTVKSGEVVGEKRDTIV